MSIYRSYVFRDKDPIIYEIWDIVKTQKLKHISDQSGVSLHTLRNWFFGDTCRPQSATIRAVLRSIGYDFKIVNESQPVHDPVTIERPPLHRTLRVIEGGKTKPGEHWKKRLPKIALKKKVAK